MFSYFSHKNQKFCDGYREVHKRVFDSGQSHPLLIPVEADMLHAMGYTLNIRDLPRTIDIIGKK